MPSNQLAAQNRLPHRGRRDARRGRDRRPHRSGAREDDWDAPQRVRGPAQDARL